MFEADLPPDYTVVEPLEKMSASPEILLLAMRSLPHGPEFRFVDRMVSLTPGVRKAWANTTCAATSIICAAICRANRFMPGVLLVEAGAQVAGMVAQEDPANPRWPRLKLTALRAVKILGSARPGETLRIEAVITGIWVRHDSGAVSASVADTKVLSAEMALSGNGPGGKAMTAPTENPVRSFDFERDTFAFRARAGLEISFRSGDRRDDHLQRPIRRRPIIIAAS
jgi:3-hydroxyacyl-[acyl-carrier-protein] dehydratase